MENKIKNMLWKGIVAAAGAAAMVACSDALDAWDDHYDKRLPLSFEGTTLQALEDKAPDFAKVVKAYGYDRELASENVYTIWAPVDGTFTLSDYVSVVTDDNGHVVSLERTADSTDVVDRFIKNHVARNAVSLNGTEQEIKLMNTKVAAMTGYDETDGQFGSCNITEANISCKNGVIHLLDSERDYQNSIFEQIRAWDDAGEDELSLYTFLKIWDTDSLDESKSLSSGTDEYGNPKWIDRVTIRNNTILKSIDAPVYVEDSSFIAIVPTAKAYQERYDIAKNLLVFNPTETKGDSLQNYYAHMFAMSDLFYNKNLNAKAWNATTEKYDSLRSTLFQSWTWPYNLYYSKEPRLGLHPDKQVNDILAKCGTPVECSNGEAYLVDEYPMTVTEQFFKKISVRPSDRTLDQSTEINTSGQQQGVFTKNIGDPISRQGVIYDFKTEEVVDEETGEKVVRETGDYTMRNFYFYDVPEKSGSNPYIGFKIPGTLSGTYSLYLVTCPIWAKTGFNDGQSIEDNTRKYRFRVNIFERNKNGEYPRTGKSLSVPAGSGTGGYFMNNNENKIDTLYLGEYTFQNSYYNRSQEGVILQIQVNVSNASTQQSLYSREMLLSEIFLMPKFEEKDDE